MVCYDYEYILSKKHNELLNNDYIEIFSKLNVHKSSHKHSNYVKLKHNNRKLESIINLELNKLNNNNIQLIFNNIKNYLNNDNNIQYFLKGLINNSIIQHNIIINYILLYQLFFQYNNNYNTSVLNNLESIINTYTDNINYKDKYIGSYIFISKLYILKIINYDTFLSFIMKFFNECDDTIQDIKLNALLKIIDFIYLELDYELQIKLKEHLINLNKNLNKPRLKFICLDILDIINK